ncbi:MAG: 50S ribosomal protein L23 [Tenuifilaceae bacterium]|nr:50S ribosomal protein L23 [Bacteroidales bacterium]MDI9515519.1 50S ribosomal protein L23 [Bacteroidota bacterium]NLH56241.1 50S ribosomal protein L23 [Rikenellaceae bacterium]OQC63610.1 MAG: 50S ribosomal protein L23 [Bacteroidetes bacterium ADurb.Bin008]HNS29101.1 50S ribosomal protein L23 [Tenuifilaceae bacterium]
MNIILRPVVTEKMEHLSEKLNRYGFIVEKTANRLQVKKAVEEAYGVNVVSVNTMRYGGKRKSRYTKAGLIAGKTNSFKKAIVTLKEGQQIDFFSNI